jgi:hypothetical protein
MSTKTSIKRIAAVAAVALTLGGFSAVSAHATAFSGNADSLTLAATTATGTTGTAAKVSFTSSFIGSAALDATKVAAVLISAPATNVVLPTVETTTTVSTTATESLSGTAAGVLTSSGYTSAAIYVSGTFKVALNAAVAGTYVVKLVPYIGSGSDATTTGVTSTTGQTVTFTITAAATADAANSTAVISAGTTYAPATADTDDVVLAAKGTTATKVAVIKVVPASAATADLTASTTLSATIAGPGTLSIGATTAGGSASVGRAITGSLADNYIAVWSDGTSGTSTVTISAGTVVLATKTLTFFGSASSYTPTLTNSIITTAAVSASTTTALGTPGYRAAKVLVKDANGNPVSGVHVYAKSDDLTVINTGANGVYQDGDATSSSTGYVYFSFAGLKAGTANISFTNRSSSADTTTEVTGAPVAIRVGSATADSVAISFDSSSYQPGAAATITVALLDSTGKPVANGVYSAFSSAGLTSSLAFLAGTTPGTAKDVVAGSTATAGPSQVALTAGQVWVKNNLGTATFTVNVPLAAGDVTLSGLGGAGLGVAQAGLAVSAKTTVGGGAAADAAQAAVDAANEATDAANAATDAANNAMDSADAAQQAALDAGDKADAALAAVTDLASKVADIATQISALSSLVSKIAASVAKISAKVKA